MSITNAIKYGALGMATDVCSGGFTRGLGTIIGGLYGLFAPDANDMDSAYDNRHANTHTTKYGGFQMWEGLFGNLSDDTRSLQRSEPKKQWPDAWKMGAVVAGAGLLLSGGLGIFGLPLYAAGLMPYNIEGFLPLAWRAGLIPDWGWTAGII